MADEMAETAEELAELFKASKVLVFVQRDEGGVQAKRKEKEGSTHAAAEDATDELAAVASAVRDASDEGMATVTPTDWQNCTWWPQDASVRCSWTFSAHRVSRMRRGHAPTPRKRRQWRGRRASTTRPCMPRRRR